MLLKQTEYIETLNMSYYYYYHISDVLHDSGDESKNTQVPLLAPKDQRPRDTLLICYLKCHITDKSS